MSRSARARCTLFRSIIKLLSIAFMANTNPVSRSSTKCTLHSRAIRYQNHTNDQHPNPNSMEKYCTMEKITAHPKYLPVSPDPRCLIGRKSFNPRLRPSFVIFRITSQAGESFLCGFGCTSSECVNHKSAGFLRTQPNKLVSNLLIESKEVMKIQGSDA